MRSLIAGAVLVSVSLAYHRRRPVGLTWLLLAAIGLFSSTFGFMGMFLAGDKITPGLATVITNIQPAIAAIIGYFVLHERLVPITAYALLIGFAGIVVVSASGLGSGPINTSLSGVAYVLLGATGVATGNVLLKRCAHHVDPLVVVGWSFIIGSIPLFIIAATLEEGLNIEWNYIFLINLLGLAIFGTAVVYVMWLDLLRKHALNRLNIFTFLTPIVALIVGAVFFNERLTLREWISTSLIFLSNFLVIFFNNGKRKNNRTWKRAGS